MFKPGLRHSRAWASMALSCAALWALAGVSASPAAANDPIVPGELIVTFEKGVSKAEGEEIAGELGADVVDRATFVPRLALVELPAGLGVGRAEDRFEAVDGVLRAEPNALRELALEPDDPFYVSGQQWGLTNPSGAPFGGKEDADIDAPGAWGLADGDPTVTVGVIDSGTSLVQPDIDGNLWVNPLETPLDSIDNDSNGIVDDVNGADIIEQDGTPDDANTHGTHVAGIIGAEGNNAVGTAGVNWDVGLMPIKAGTADGSLPLFAILDAIEYADLNGARVVNASYTGDDFSQGEHDALAAANDVLFVAAAGNSGTDNDASPRYPCNYDLPNVICVAATNPLDNLSAFSSGGSNYGQGSVDLAAPGSTVLSTLPTFAAPEFSDDFEAGLTAWTLEGTLPTWATSAELPHSGALGLTDSPGANYAPNSDNSVRLTTPLDLSGSDACRMRFSAAYSFASGDGIQVEASPDSVAWTPIGSLTGTQTALAAETVDLFTFSGLATVYLRFRLISNASGNADGAHIDNVVVECEDPAPATPSFGFKSGTSMATPHVAGVAALLLDRFPTYTVANLRSALLGNVDRLPSLHCKVASGGRLNAFDALDNGVPQTAPSADCPPVTPTPATQSPTTQSAAKPNPLTKAIKRCKRKFRKGSRARKRCIAKARAKAAS